MSRTPIVLAAAVGLACLAALAPVTGAKLRPAEPGDPPPPPAAPAAGTPDFGAMLTRGLEASEGCLGVDTARFASGKVCIVAWFEDAEAVERWYYSETHTRFMSLFGGDPEARKPLRHVENREAPVMVMAAITLGGEKRLPGPMPISQISIEVYTPLPAGAAINGRLAPEGFEIPHFRELAIGG